MSLQKTSLASIIAFLLITQSAYAEDNKEDTTFHLPGISVTGARIVDQSSRSNEEPAYSRLSLPESVSAETIFTAEDIEKIHPTTIFDILLLEPTVLQNFSNSMSPKNLKSRGGETIGLIIDGTYIPSTQSTRMLANFPVTIIESIRIVKDSTALTVGPLATISNSTTKPNAAVDGYIIIKTKKTKKSGDSYKLSYDSFKNTKASYSIGNASPNRYYTISFNHSDIPAWNDHNDAAKTNSVYIRNGYYDENIVSNLSLYFDWASWECPRLNNNEVLGEALWKFDPSNTTMVSFDLSKLWNPENVTTVNFGYSRVKSTLLENYTDCNSSILRHGKYAPMEWELNEQVRDYNLSHALSSGKNTLKLGAQALFWDMRDMQGFTYRSKKEEGFGYYITDEFQVDSKLSLDAGARMDRRHTIKQTDPTFNDTWAENNITYAFGAAYKFNPVYKLTSRFSYSKQPSYDWLLKIDDTSAFEPDTRKKYELGLDAAFNESLNLGCTLFYHDISNYKYVAKQQANSATGLTDYYYGSADVIQKGVEVSLNGKLSDHFSYQASYAYLNVDDASVSKTLPKNSASAMLNYMNNDYSCNIIARRMGGYSQSATKGDGLGDYTRIDASISKSLPNDSKITLFGKNLTNKHYAEAYMNGAVSGMLGYIYNRGSVIGIEFSKGF